MKPTTTRGRLNLYRKRASESKWANDWRNHKYGNTWGAPWINWSKDRRKIYTEARDTLGDYLGDWGDLYPWRPYRDATGFYVDNYCIETMRGGVERIRTARGTLYVPVTYCTGWDAVTYYMAAAEMVERGSPEEDHDKAKSEAARTAYDYAEQEADRCREDDAKERAKDDIHDRRTEIHDINKAARALLAEIRGQEFTENVCAALRRQLQEYLAERRKCFAVIKERKANYWSAVSY